MTPLLVLAALTLLPVTAEARPQAASVDVVIKVGDAVAIARTHIGCYGVTGGRKDGIVCFKVDSKGLAPGTFGVGAAEDGTVTAYKITSNRKPKRIFKRTLQALRAPEAMGAPAKTITLGVGKVFSLAGTNVLCEIVRVGRSVPPLFRGVKVACYRADALGPLPSSYGVAVSDKFAGVFAFDAARSPGANVIVRAQP